MPMKDWLYRLQPVQLYIILLLSIAYFLVQLVYCNLSHALTLLVHSYHMLCNIIALTGCIITIKNSKIPSGFPRNNNDDDDNNNNQPQLTSTATAVITKTTTPSINDDGKKFVVDNKTATTIANSIPSSLDVKETGTTTTTTTGVKKQTTSTTTNNEPNTNKQQYNETSLRNTFGWTRIDILTMLIVCIVLSSLCFSAFIEAIQTLIHIDHQDEMHYEIIVLIIGLCGLTLNGLCYLLIGGFTFHQGSFLHTTTSNAAGGNILLNQITTCDDACGIKTKDEQRNSSKLKPGKGVVDINSTNDVNNANNLNNTDKTKRNTKSIQKENWLEILRDNCSSVFVIICSIIVYFIDNESVLKWIDPLMSMVSAIVLLSLSYPYMKESCLILLQTIPATIDIEQFKGTLLKSFPDIDNVHDLHVWQLTRHKYVSTAHIVFQNPEVYCKIMESIKMFFHEQGITIVTIQPEFLLDGFRNTTKLIAIAPLPTAAISTGTTTTNAINNNQQTTNNNNNIDDESKCLMRCKDSTCNPKKCCKTNNDDELLEKSIKNDKHKKKCNSTIENGCTHNNNNNNGGEQSNSSNSHNSNTTTTTTTVSCTKEHFCPSTSRAHNTVINIVAENMIK